MNHVFQYSITLSVPDTARPIQRGFIALLKLKLDKISALEKLHAIKIYKITWMFIYKIPQIFYNLPCFDLLQGQVNQEVKHFRFLFSVHSFISKDLTRLKLYASRFSETKSGLTCWTHMGKCREHKKNLRYSEQPVPINGSNSRRRREASASVSCFSIFGIVVALYPNPATEVQFATLAFLFGDHLWISLPKMSRYHNECYKSINAWLRYV